MFTSKIQDGKSVYMKMKNMKPLQIAKIVDENSPGHFGNIVMRTASTLKFEVMRIWPDPDENACWTDTSCDLEVKPLPSGIKIILTVKKEN